MAGQNQHYIPQLLQRGFAAKVTKGGNHHVYVFRKGISPHLKGTASIFVSRDFYGPPDDTSLDDTISEMERRVVAFIECARAAISCMPLGKSEDAESLIHQMSIRGKWIRDFGSRAMSMIVEPVVNAMATPEGVVGLLIDRCRREPLFLANELEKQLATFSGRSLLPGEKIAARALADSLLGKPSLMAEILGPVVIPDAALFKGMIPDAANRGHTAGLIQAFGPKSSPFRDYVNGLTWEIAPTSSRVVLGDCGPLFFDNVGSVLGPIGATERSSAAGLLLPLGATVLLVGRVAVGEVLPDVRDINRASAGWSSEAFIASTLDEETHQLHASIGKLLTQRLETEVAEALREYLPAESRPENLPPA